jgi:hypothetical protein
VKERDFLGGKDDLTGMSAATRLANKKLDREERARVERFLKLPPALQEGVLKYGENIRKKYSDGGIDKS